MESPPPRPPPPPLKLKPFDGKKLNHSPPSKSLSSPSDGHRDHVSQSDLEVVTNDILNIARMRWRRKKMQQLDLQDSLAEFLPKTLMNKLSPSHRSLILSRLVDLQIQRADGSKDIQAERNVEMNTLLGEPTQWSNIHDTIPHPNRTSSKPKKTIKFSSRVTPIGGGKRRTKSKKRRKRYSFFSKWRFMDGWICNKSVTRKY